MILYNASQYPTVFIHFKQSDWNWEQYQTIMTELKLLLSTAEQTSVRIKLFIQGNAEIEVNPPLKFWWWVINDLLSVYTQLKVALDKTAIYKPNDNMNGFFKLLFTVYKPARPMQIFTDAILAQTWLQAPTEA